MSNPMAQRRQLLDWSSRSRLGAEWTVATRCLVSLTYIHLFTILGSFNKQPTSLANCRTENIGDAFVVVRNQNGSSKYVRDSKASR